MKNGKHCLEINTKVEFLGINQENFQKSKIELCITSFLGNIDYDNTGKIQCGHHQEQIV